MSGAEYDRNSSVLADYRSRLVELREQYFYRYLPLCGEGANRGTKREKYILSDESLTDVTRFVRTLDQTTPAGIAPEETKFGEKTKLADTRHYYEIDLNELPAAPMDMPTPTPSAYQYGIYGAVVTPYRNL